jgi:membrane protein implicated in regulation of membrane protease activity
MPDWILWLIIIFILIIAEVSTVSLVSIWFIISGIVSLVFAFFIDSFAIQFAVFVILGLILLLSTRSVLKKYLDTKKVNTNLDMVVGQTAIVTEVIKKNKVGEVKVLGKKWSAISKQKLEIDEEVIVEAIDGVKLIVRKKDE